MKSPEIHLMKVCYSRFFVVILQALYYLLQALYYLLQVLY